MASSQNGQTRRQALEQELRDWWDERTEEFENDIRDGSSDGTGLWRQMPVIDSKEVTRTKPIFEDHLDGDFDPEKIRDGGYDSIDDIINHLVPAQMDEG